MIIATIQNLKKGDEQILAKDGVILSGYEREVILNKFFNDIFEIELKDNIEECFFFNENQLFCYIYHPQLDEANRKRRALILFEKNAREEVCKSTIEVMGLSWDRFCELRDKALISNKVSKFLNIKTLTLIVVILMAIIFAIFL
ncbi:MAG: hypothetical protein IKK93_11005 [Campylobacter sp.]|nr:hypothetical protein [Campylobacter sp.]